MSKDAPVNTGAMVWPDMETAESKVWKMQTKLHYWAQTDPARRFGDLFNLVYDPAFLMVAFRKVATNKGAKTAGVDKVTAVALKARYGEQTVAHVVRERLKKGEFRPSKVRQVMIPKSGGKMRQLGIPTVEDRIVQASLKLVLEPIFEADFQPCSYGFRPNRRAQDAITEILQYANHSYHWVMEADIEACFDRIDHVALMDKIRTRIKDKRVLALVKAFLKAGIMTREGNTVGTFTGTPQGGILSPLLANIALSILDDHFMAQYGTQAQRAKRRYHGQPNYRLIRYADDFVVMVHGTKDDAYQAKDDATRVLAPMGLTLSEEKTRVVHIDQGFDFLGFHIQRKRKKGTKNKTYVYTWPSKKSVNTMKRRASAAFYRHTQTKDLDDILDRLSSQARGWATYFRSSVAKVVFAAIDSHIWVRAMKWLSRKHKRMSWIKLKQKFCIPGTWLLSHNGKPFQGTTSVAIKRYTYRGNTIPAPWPWKLAQRWEARTL